MPIIRLVNPAPKQSLTMDQVAQRQAKAVRFARDVVGDTDLADEIEGLSVDEYAERKGFQMANPPSRKEVTTDMTRQTEDKLDELGQKIDSLVEALKERGARPGNSRSTVTRSNPRVSTFSHLSHRAKEKLLDEREEILDALEEAQDALDECRYDEAQEILDEILDQYEAQGEEDEEES